MSHSPVSKNAAALYTKYIGHPAVFDAFESINRNPEQVGLSNLFVHQYQIAITALTSFYNGGEELATGDQDCFTWTYTKEPSCDLEALARELYQLALVEGYNHAILHVAISGIAHLSLMAGNAPWDLADTGSYTVLTNGYHWMSICSAHRGYDKDCPRCHIGSYMNQQGY